MPSLVRQKPETVWVITDGKAGDIAQCAGVAEALGCSFQMKQIAPRAPWSWWLPFGPGDPHDLAAGGPLAPPYPDIAIASGRRAVGYLKALKRRSAGSVFTVCLKDPRTGTGAADLIWVPEHDALRGANVLVSATAPHRFSAAALAGARAAAAPAVDALPRPRVAVLAGGNSRHHTFTPADVARLLDGLRALVADTGASLMITTSRRTPAPLSKGLEDLAAGGRHLFWDGAPPNPITTFLAKADAIVATADSTNMIGEAAATGRPIHVFHPSGGHPKIKRFLTSLDRLGATHPFPAPLKTTTYEPLDSTQMIAERILSGFDALRTATDPAARNDRQSAASADPRHKAVP